MAASHLRPRDRRALLGAAMTAVALVAGCAQFPNEHPNSWKAQPSLEPQVGPQPSIEGELPPAESGAPQAEQPDPQAGGCQDPNPAVVATCLDPVGAVVALPDGQSALVAERATGRILRTRKNREPVEVARVPVDPSGGGGLTALALSPSYHEDELFFAYVTTGGDNQVLRIAPGDRPKPIFTGIPKGASGNAGALLDDGTGALLVATGDAGSPSAVADPASLAGKVLRIDSFGAPAVGNPDPRSPVVSSGLSSPGGLCGRPETGGYWVTDNGGAKDSLYRLRIGEPLGAPSWVWNDRPGVSGCASSGSVVVVALTNAAALYTMHPTAEGTFTGDPTKVMANSFGRFSAATLGPDGLLWLGTANKAGGKPVPSDDRVIRIEPPSGGTAGKD